MKTCKSCKSKWLKPGTFIDWHCRRTTIAKATRILSGSDADLLVHSCKFWESGK